MTMVSAPATFPRSTDAELYPTLASFEYLILNIRNCNYAGSGWVQILHSVNRMMSKLHYMLEKGAITTYKKDKVDC